MKSPLWILNSTFTVLFLFSLLIMFFMRIQIPPRTSLVPQVLAPARDNDISKINPALIYENDPFGTVFKPVEQKAGEKEEEEPEIFVPTPPNMVSPTERSQAAIEFLPPLSLKLRGIIFNSNALYSRAMIANTKTNTEALYRVGDKIEDATLIHISKRKVVFIRPNSQQELLFINEEDAEKDPLYQGERIWSKIITPLDENVYRIDSTGFGKHITNVAQIFDQLDVTTAFDKGKNIGCRIGKLSSHSLGGQLGLHQGDVVVAVNNIPPTTTKNRVSIYQAIKNAGVQQRISVFVLRGGQQREIVYMVQKITDEEDVELKEAEEAAMRANRIPGGIPLGRNAGGLPFPPSAQPVNIPPAPLSQMPIRTPSFGSSNESIMEPKEKNMPEMTINAQPGQIFQSPTEQFTPIPMPEAAIPQEGILERNLAENPAQSEVENTLKRRDQKSMLGYGSRSAVLQR